VARCVNDEFRNILAKSWSNIAALPFGNFIAQARWQFSGTSIGYKLAEPVQAQMKYFEKLRGFSKYGI